MEEQEFGYKNPTLVEFYDEYIKDKEPGNRDLAYFVIDISSGTETNLEEFARFMKEFNIKNVLIRTDDGKKVADALTHLPVNQVRGLYLDGNLEGIQIKEPIQSVREDSDEQMNLDALDDITFRNTSGSYIDLPEVYISKNLTSINFEGVGSIGTFITHSDRDPNKDLAVDTNWRNTIDLTKTENTKAITRIIGPLFDLTEENIDLISKKFPNIRKLNFVYSDEVPTAKTIDQLAFLISNNGRAKYTPGFMNPVRYFIGKGNNQHKLCDIVEFPDGEYYNISKYGTSVTKDDVYHELRMAKVKKPESPFVYGIRSITDLSLEEAIKLKEAAGDTKIAISFKDSDVPVYSRGSYTLDKYIAIQTAMKELLQGIDKSMPEKERFAAIYKRVAEAMYYDREAAYPQNLDETYYKRGALFSSRNFDALFEGKGVCAGYAFILQNACEMMGIEARYVSGPVYSVQSGEKDPNAFVDPDEVEDVVKDLGDGKRIVKEYHAWNKVILDGVGYNVDSTWDHGRFVPGKIPSFALVSDKTLQRTGRKGERIYGGEDFECTQDFPEEELAKLFGLATEKSRFTKFKEFITGRKATPKREFYFTPEVLEFLTGEKVEDVQKELNGEEPKNIFVRAAERIKAFLTKENPKMLPQGGEEKEEQPIPASETVQEQPEASWTLTQEQAEKVNVQEAVEQTRKNSELNQKNKENDGPSINE